VIQPGAVIGEGAVVTRCIVADDMVVPAKAVCGSAKNAEIELVAEKVSE
jgi:glucose-1-phosphate adenylyltransferase